MKSLEERISKECLWGRVKLDMGVDADILRWRWDGMPTVAYGLEKRVHSMIEKADLSACLTSPSAYVREYRKYHESRRKNK